ncbi:hypothetical protein CFBP4996_26325 (plasmid) [Agrobacterium leguminum]|uniref:hypothetical protein n=1 Tax=Agrobacterium leguminum TaxID=2792015 RepID=UPI0010CA13DD|nr:hypothetical protein [Agrobacterium leguminum]WFS69592.1 hypothetical protein CFBP4996_26325 [Agrobacterium leguminum]
MKGTNILSAALLSAGALWAATPAQAEDASWGCQVLLCAASSNPSWHGVPYCVPPMQKLISAMAKPGFDWPICHEAKAGSPGREVFEACPEGSKPGSRNTGYDNNFGRDEQDQCVKTVNVCENGRNQNFRRFSSDSRESCIQTVYSPRPRRADPYFFDIPNDKGVKQRFWFNLND